MTYKLKWDITLAQPAQFDTFVEIELAAFQTLSAAGAVSGPAEATSHAEFRSYLDDGLLLAALDWQGNAVGFAAAHFIESNLHISEMDVHPDWQGQGIGRGLMQRLLEEARTRRLQLATLTTDRFAPFNAPFYTSLGFQILSCDGLPAYLASILDAEHSKGFDPARRVAIALKL